MDKPRSSPVIANPWADLRRFTEARIALGRSGVSLPTRPHLEFQFAWARARDAVHLTMDPAALEQQLARMFPEVINLHSAAVDRHTYLRRPDLGRRLDPESRRRLEQGATAGSATDDENRLSDPHGFDVAFAVVDGLSALAVHVNASPFLEALIPKLTPSEWRLAPLTLIEQGRVAIGDEIGELLGAAMVVVLIGERPGLSSPNSLGIYFTYGPRVGLTDVHRNCISNIHKAGLTYDVAAHKLHYLMTEARRRKLSGVRLKDEATVAEIGSGRA